MKFNLKQVKYKNIIEYKTIRVEKVFWVTININAWTDSVGEWGRLPMAILDYLCLTFRALMVGEKKTNSFTFSSDHHMHHGPPTQNKQICKKDEQFCCCCVLLGIKPRVLYMRCQVLTTPSSFDPFFLNPFLLLLIERSTLLLMWKTGCTLIEWHMTFQTVGHRTSLEWLSRFLPLMKGS